MPIAEARVPTDHPSRYLARLCKQPGPMDGALALLIRLHGGGTRLRIRHAEWSGTHGTIDVGSGRCTLDAGPGSLTLRIEATDRDSLRDIQDLIAGRLRKIGAHDSLQITWQQTESVDAAHTATVPAELSVPRRRRRATLGAVALIVLVVAVHLGLGGLLLVSGPWRHWLIGALVAVVVAKAAHVLARRASRRGNARQAR
ncbi:DUF2218 domain-containing protein [Streptomyces sp. NPDC026673]|uniref:DUF2218 domain-containing protein n=1 Tax=Streptomyces sp. NPDC026673 TaxID=3155724 RepID=UPI0033C390B6